ncbi:hypothetical protein JVU11DRAFT_6508 [Chiua virens]|nr:hypothetical protein JVU11DRAFT_6508 [Chiua virens]
MSTRIISTGHVLPPNPTFIDFPVSDGDDAQWPTNTTRVVDSEGLVNYMRPVPIDESLSIKWRCEVGASLALQLKKPVGPTYVLRGWPAGYQMFDHNKGPASAPRHDAYLIGSRHAKRFRSVPEFIPHALWLLTDPGLVRSNCNCKYCNKKPQREITASMGLIPSRRSTPLSTVPRAATTKVSVNTQSASASSSRPARERAKPYAAIRRVPRPMKQPQGPKQNMLRERNSRFALRLCRRSQAQKMVQGRRIAMARRMPSLSGLSLLMVQICPSNEVQADESAITAQNGNGSNTGNNDIPWTVIQTLSYKIKLLGIPFSYYIPADQVLPYQAHAPSDELIQAIHRVPLEQLNIDTNSFRPTGGATFVNAAAAYALAVQIAANIAGYWAPTDDWEYKFSIPPPNYLSQCRAWCPTWSIARFGYECYNLPLHNVASQSGFIFAPPPLALTQPVTQTRYQGLWWGAERIWTDELLPKEQRIFLPPAGPSHKALEYTKMLNVTEGDGEAVVGAESRGVFMRIDGLYVADISKPDGAAGKECRVSGLLFELVDEDWEEEQPNRGASGDDGGKGKGKGKAAEVPATLGDGESRQRSNSPATPAEGNAAAVDSSMNSKSKERSPNEQLSHPILSSPFPLPPPPEGFKFRPILAPGHEAVLSLNLIAGRYYPRLLQHPLLDRDVEKALDIEAGRMIETSQLWALEGLAPGYYNTMDPVRWRANRAFMIREADKDARQGLEEHWHSRAKEIKEKQIMESGYLPPQPLPSSMAVDTDIMVGMSISQGPLVRREIQPEAMVVDS